MRHPRSSRRSNHARPVFSPVLVLLALVAVPSVLPQSSSIRAHYSKTEYMVPMRDGVRLYTQIYSPKDTSERYPILFNRTPYGVGHYGLDAYRPMLGPSRGFADAGYIFVYQDIRGKFRSEGTFQHHRAYEPVKAGPLDTDESSDVYDTIEWLLATIPQHNGRVGQWGISYPGWLTAMGMIDPHPALYASSPQGSPANQFKGDDYYHNGAFRLVYAFNWTSHHARVREGGPNELRSTSYDFGTPDGYRFFLNLGPAKDVNERYFQGTVPTWDEFVSHWTYDEYWQSKNLLKDLIGVRHAVLNVVGWFDAEDFDGSLAIYTAIEESSTQNESILVVGPWQHGGWAGGSGDRLGAFRFGGATGRHFRENVQLPFFNYHLKQEGDFDQSEALVFETGSNRWRSFAAWPPPGAVHTPLYLRDDGSLSFDLPPEHPAAHDSFLSDPNKPVPYTADIRTDQGHTWMVEDQRFAATRPDVLVYETEPLQDDLTIGGQIAARLFVTTSGEDADWVVKLIDVFPEDARDTWANSRNIRMGGYQMMLTAEVFRSKFRNGFEKAQPMIPERMTKIEFRLPDRNHTFREGHRIMIQIQSTWFPLIDRNPQTFGNIHQAVRSDYHRATHRVYRSTKYPSHVSLPILLIEGEH